MKKGISRWAFPDEMPLSEIFLTAKKAGFDGVEVTMDIDGELSPDTTDEEVSVIKAAAETAGIELYSVAASVYWSVSLVADDEAERQKAKEYVKKQLHLAKLLGCDTILVIPGHTGVDFAPELGIVDYSTAYIRAVEAAKELAPFAEESGVVICMENVWNKFLVSPLEMNKFLDEVGSSYVKSYFDVGNTMQCGYPVHWIRILKDKIKAVHLKDFKCSIGNLDGFCELLTGDVDYKGVMEAFETVGYDGWVTSEVMSGEGTLNEFIKRTSDAMDKIIRKEL